MDNPEALFHQIAKLLTDQDPQVEIGKMMSSPGIKYRDKVFAFYHNEMMGFLPGPNFDPIKAGVLNAKPLSPFKTKPPLKGWFLIRKEESNQWEYLATRALEFTQKL